MMVTYPSSNIKKNTYDILIYWLMLLIFFCDVRDGMGDRHEQRFWVQIPKTQVLLCLFSSASTKLSLSTISKHRKVRV